MPLSLPSLRTRVVNQDGVAVQVWSLFFSNVKSLLDNSKPWQLPSYTVSGVPAAADWEGHIIYVSNEAGGKTIAFSDGVSWRRTQDRNVIS